MAMQGKLVEQRPEEGTGEELYQQIQKEKQKLIKEGKIKREKPLPEITEDEVPFEIPESWKWVRIGNICELNPKNEASDEADASFIPMALVDDGYRDHHTFEVKKWGNVKKGFSHFQDGDLGVAKITPCFQNRKSVIFRDLVNGIGAGTTELTIIRPMAEYTLREYLLLYFKSEQFIKDGVKSFTGTAGQQRIHKDFLRTYPIPLPPLAEQKRIVAKIEEIMPFIDRYTTAYENLQSYNARFPDDLKKSILQMAIQGKLVPQDPNDEPASILLEKIAKEKQKLVKEGKIKKQKPLPPIKDEEIPFDIPESWEWVRLGNAALTIVDCPHSTPKYFNTETIFKAIDTNCINESGEITEWRFIDEPTYYQRIDRMKPRKDDIIYTREGSICRAAILPDNSNVCLGQRVMAIRPGANLCAQYLQMVLMTFYVKSALTSKQKGIGAKHVNVGDVCNIEIPLPPLAEQKRIVTKLDELLPQIDSLK